MLGLQIFVIHVKGDKQRAEHINNELSKFNLEAEFILDGNIEDITEQRLDKYFDGKMHTISATTSCSLKHIIAYEQILKRNIDKVLIFEDDIILKSNFIQIIEQILLEIENRGLANYIVSLENTNHAYIKKNELINNQILYKKETSRCAGAYLIDYEGKKHNCRNTK
jgi:glycosyl transferase family 25